MVLDEFAHGGDVQRIEDVGKRLRLVGGGMGLGGCWSWPGGEGVDNDRDGGDFKLLCRGGR